MTAARRGVRGRRYRSLDEFYADPERWMSRERDLGLSWIAADGAVYRAAWIARTEELYAVRYRTPDGGGGTVEVLGCISAAHVDVALSGWSDVCGEPSSYEWLRERVRRSGGRSRPKRARRARGRSAPFPAH